MLRTVRAAVVDLLAWLLHPVLWALVWAFWLAWQLQARTAEPWVLRTLLVLVGLTFLQMSYALVYERLDPDEQGPAAAEGDVEVSELEGAPNALEDGRRS